MPRIDRSQPMPVKHWSFAGLMLSHACSARCASCYLGSAPDRPGRMSTDFALRVWEQLQSASPHGCRIHVSGGEPFLDIPALLDLCRQGRARGLGPLQKVETNAFWATDERTVRDTLRALDDAGMQRLALSADPYHQQYVPLARVRLLARLGAEVLGPARVQVRWEDWLRYGADTHGLDDAERRRLFAAYAARGRDRLVGRAARRLAPLLPRRPVESFAGSACGEALLRSRHVHVDPDGWIMPGVCAGLALGRVGPQTVSEVWASVYAHHAARPLLGTLAEHGPAGLLPLARAMGWRAEEGYASKCHLCWEVRSFLAHAPHGPPTDELQPRWMYEHNDRNPTPHRIVE